MRYADKLLFSKFQNFFPFSCVDLILIKNNQFLLVRRTIPPYENRLCLPGGIVRKDEKMSSAIKRIGKDELGVKVKIIKSVGFYEKIYKNRHDITHCFVVKIEKGSLKLDHQAREMMFFNKIPRETAGFFKIMLQDAGFF
ncbi:MAG: NUDIX hydrolase [Patescibacteria group bacterium]|nr:NUDIX hydrolase [Patescibacteria group bacterium]